MHITPIKTRILQPPKDNFDDILTEISNQLTENSIVVITSKIVSISEGNCIKVSNVPDKDKLIKQQADFYLDRNLVPGGWTLHTLKNNLLIPTAGIDQSNANGYYVLWPVDPKRSAAKIWHFLQQNSLVKNFGVIITDSHSIPMRRGVIGISLSYYGFQPLHDYRGQDDLFGNKLKMSQSNYPDSLAAAAVVAMGEGSEQTPIALITDLPETIDFKVDNQNIDQEFGSFEVPLEEDLFKPILEAVTWQKGGSGH